MNLFRQRPRILMVCTENLCRSPMAEGLLRHYLAEMGLDNKVEVASAGTVVHQPGLKPDPRGLKVAAESGIDISKVRAKRVTEKDFERCSMILAMDEGNLEDLKALCPPMLQDKLDLLLSFGPDGDRVDVPDPYYGSSEGFQSVFEIMDAAIYELVPYVVRRFG